MKKINLFKETLIKFLDDGGSLTAFSNNLDGSLDDLLRSEDVQLCPALVIRKGFYWSKSPEGKQYWKTISGEWSTFLFDHKYLYKEINREDKKKISPFEYSF